MKLAVSTIAWSIEEDEAVAELLVATGTDGIEMAPTRHWPDLAAAPPRAVARRRAFWDGHGLTVVAMQALLYGRPDLQLFGSEQLRQAMLDYLCAAIRVGAGLGASVLVFGSPRNRVRGTLDPVQADALAVDFFRRLGDAAAAEGVMIGLEANPPAYGCDFLTTNAELAGFVDRVAHPGVRRHFDLGGTLLAGEDPAGVVTQGPPLRHLHASAPHLGPLGESEAPLGQALGALARHGYRDWVSIEMRPQPGVTVEAIRMAIDIVRRAESLS